MLWYCTAPAMASIPWWLFVILLVVLLLVFIIFFLCYLCIKRNKGDVYKGQLLVIFKSFD